MAQVFSRRQVLALKLGALAVALLAFVAILAWRIAIFPSSASL